MENVSIRTKWVIFEKCKNNLAINKGKREKEPKNLSFKDRKIVNDNNFPNSLLHPLFHDQTILMVL